MAGMTPRWAKTAGIIAIVAGIIGVIAGGWMLAPIIVIGLIVLFLPGARATPPGE